MIAVARTNQKGNEISLEYREFLARDHDFLPALRDPNCETLPGSATPQFQGPGDTVPAFRMRMLDPGVDAQWSIDRAAPAHPRLELRRRMHRHPMRLHVAGNAHMLVQIGRASRRGRA